MEYMAEFRKEGNFVEKEHDEPSSAEVTPKHLQLEKIIRQNRQIIKENKEMKKQINLLERMVAEIYTNLFPDQYTPGPSNAPVAADKGTQKTVEHEEATGKSAKHEETAVQQDYSAVQEVIQKLNIDEIQAEEEQKNDMPEK
ncbi:hypothetical protein TorRG33x02_309880, partial [Trema orientale]